MQVRADNCKLIISHLLKLFTYFSKPSFSRLKVEDSFIQIVFSEIGPACIGKI